MFIPSGILVLIAGGILVLIFAVSFIEVKNRDLKAKLSDALHKKAEIGNFMSLFSQNLKSVDEIDNSMNMTARYVADLIEAQSICVFEVEGDFLKATGISGAFPPLHKSNQYVLTKPRYILETLKRDKIKIGEGLIGEVAASREFVFLEDPSKDPRLAETDSSIPINTLMAVPLVNDGKTAGVICAVNNRRSDKPFTAEQFSRLKFIASQVVLAQNIVHVYSDLSRQQRIDQELEFARSLQSSLLPKSFPPWGIFGVQAFSRSSKEVSGDFYDFVEIDENRLLIVVGDACGKGIPACMIMAMTRSFIRSNIEKFTTLKNLLRELNDNLFRDTDDERFITLACCVLDKKESTIEYARAGHTEMIIYVRKHTRSIFPDGSALGLLPSELSEFDTMCTNFTPGMAILLFTDGISEAMNPRGEEFGVERLTDSFMKLCVNAEAPESMIDKILDDVDTFKETATEQEDDQTLVIIKHV